MAKQDSIVIKNISVSPERVTNDGQGAALVSAVVFTGRDRAAIDQVMLELEPLKGSPQIPMKFVREKGLADSLEGLYTCSVNIPSLTDPGWYKLSIHARDTLGTHGREYAELRVDYKSPEPCADILGPQCGRVFDEKAGSPLVRGNKVLVLADGGEAFKARTALVGEAVEQINISTYTLSSDGMCGELLDAIIEKAAQGVEVNFILNLSTQLAVSPLIAVRIGLQKVGRDLQEMLKEVDEALEGRQGLRKMWNDIQDIFQPDAESKNINAILVDEQAILGKDGQGGKLGQRSTKWLEKMARDENRLDKDISKPRSEKGLGFRGPAGLPALPLLSYAVHEKILLVDGKKAIVGGRNLEDQYFTHWIDKDVYLEGPIVSLIQAGFLRTWNNFSKNLERDQPAKPMDAEPEPAGDCDLRFIQSRPWLGEYHTLEFLVSAFQMARERILISSQYLVLPDSLLRDALLDAAGRGVEISILTNSYETVQEVGFSAGYFISLNYCGKLIEAGIKIFEIDAKGLETAPYLHTKELMIDGKFAAIGSFNLSIRSCYIESENLVQIQDPAIVGELEEQFLHTLKHQAIEITPEYLRRLTEKYQTRMNMAKYLELLY